MNANVAGYTIYLAIALAIVWRLGRRLHRGGRIFIVQLYGGETGPADVLNNLLLVAYYLFNTGYALERIQAWQTVTGAAALTAALARQTGTLILILGCTHYLNMLMLFFITRHRSSLSLLKKQTS